VRQALIGRLPQLTKFYGLTPSDIDAMTLREVLEYTRQLDEYIAKEESG
jgi:hypothetical protein